MSCTSGKRPTSLQPLRRAAVAFLLIVAVAGCDSRKPRPHITPSVSFNRKTVEMGAPVDVSYSFRTDPAFPGLNKDLIVFVHFIDPKGVIRFVDDHTPPILTNQWKASGEYTYTRTIFVPENIPAGRYIVELGMYVPIGRGERFVLNAKMRSERTYEVATLDIRPPELEQQVEYTSGWYDVEREPNNNWYHWRWTAGEASKRVPNPRAESLLYLNADTDRARFAEAPTVSVLVNGRPVDSFTVDTAEPFVKKYRLSREQLGTGNTVDLRLRTDRTFKPSDTGSSSDSRPLALRVYSFYLDKAAD